MKTKSFKYWKSQEVDLTFGTWETKYNDFPLLSNWLSTKIEIEKDEQIVLEKLRQDAETFITGWNEQDLIFFFISGIINLARIFEPSKYRFFADHMLKAEVEGYHLNGFADLVLASGKYEPIAPYFFLHEYKKEQNFEADPRGQLLAEMLAAQAINNNGKPIYGCYVIGRNWFFCVLSGKEYSFSLAYDCTKPEIFDIFRILKGFKHILDTEILV
jgi:hypothetical protein